MTSKNINIMVSAGEASSDAHAAHALEALANKGIRFTSFGMGAGHLQDAGTELLVDCRDLAVIGIVDVLLNYHKFLRRLRLLRDTMKARKPDLLLLVDYPDFNLKLAETAKTLNIPVLFYVSPQVWAWRAGRLPRIGSLVSHMAVLFPFEVDIYERAGIPVSYVGNPVVADAVSKFSRNQARKHFEIANDQPLLALLPGSRTGEITRNLPVMLETARALSAARPGIRFLLPVAPTLEASFIEQTIGTNPPEHLSVVLDDSRHVMRAADVALVASGTATLETALIGTPMVVMYIVSKINYAIMKRLIKIPDIALVNIVAEKRIVPEYVQDAAKPQAMAADILSLFDDDQRRQKMLADIAQVKEKMGDANASNRIANLILSLSTETADPDHS